MRAAIYARVSTERQERQQTIGSQVSALRDWADNQGHALAEAHVFRDEGYSGSRLDRPALDALRDAVRDATIDVVAVVSPDRLARKYAYQVLLMEEFRRAGCQVVFLHHPISDNPNGPYFGQPKWAWFETCQFQVTPEVDRALTVKGFLVLGVALVGIRGGGSRAG
jgi:DNA invertase Pin-like site-specific DNA recombinase